MARFGEDARSEDDRAFIELMAGIHRTLDSHKIMFAECRAKVLAIEALQETAAKLTAAATLTKTADAAD